MAHDPTAPLALAPIIARDVNLLDVLLPALASELGPEFCVEADCGAGIGYTTLRPLEILRKGLGPQRADAATVYAYEPLPENISVLTEAFANEPKCVLRPVAVSDKAGQATFSVPNRLPTDWGAWKTGTSYAGFLDQPGEWMEQITVPTVRLEDEAPERFDFVKLDLQGGEHKAILGLGAKLETTKLLYVEHQLLKEEESIAFLRDRGFTVLFDAVAFGVRGAAPPDLDYLAGFGLKTIKSHQIPTTEGHEAVMNGYLDPRPDILHPDTLSLQPALAGHFQSKGVTWLQTDVLAIHPSIVSTVMGVLNRI